MRVGIGYDIHRLVKGRKLFLGGVHIPYAKGLLGHSDADALIHAVCDALLGALAAGDIGGLFPDTDPKYKGIPSSFLLKKVLALVKEKKYRVSNIDTVIIAQEPKLISFRMKIQNNLARILGVKDDRVSIKAKTNEGLGDIGKNKAIACYAVAVINRGRP